jgi:hypothetical protein
MSVDSIKETILDLCSEDAYGSWDLWWAVRAEFSEVDRPQAHRDFVAAIGQLVKEGKIASVKYVEGGPFEPVIFDEKRLDREVQQADSPNGKEFYWFDLVS